MVRGDFLIGKLVEGDWEALQNDHWMVARMEGERRLFNSYIATGTGTAFLTGLGRLLIPLAPHREGIDGVLAEILLSRLFHVLSSVFTALLLLALARRLGLTWAGQIALLSYFTFDPILQEMGSLGHLESFLTLTIPVTLLLFGLSRRQRSLPLCLVAGVVFGLAFANRINGGVVVIAALAYVALRLLFHPEASESVWRSLWRDCVQLGLLCLVGWAVFILCFPPLWKSPVFGFADFLYQHAALTGAGPDFDAAAVLLWTDSKLRFLFVLLSLAGLFLKPVRSSRVFQLGFLLLLFGVVIVSLPGKSYARYLASVLPGLGLAGSCTVAYAVDLRGTHSTKIAKRMAGILLVLSIWSVTLISIRHWESQQRTRDFYGKLHTQNFSRIDVPGFRSSFFRTEADPTGPALRVSTVNNHSQLFHLGVLLTDGRRFHEVTPGWVRGPLETRSRCLKGDWRMERTSRRTRATENGIRYGGVIAWPCGG